MRCKLSCYNNLKQESVLTVPIRWELLGAQALWHSSTLNLNLKQQTGLGHLELKLMSHEKSLGELEIPLPDSYCCRR